MQNRLWLNLLVLFASVATIALAAAPASRPAGEKHAVSIKDMAFAPASLDIKTGDTVVWTNNDDRDHNVTEGAGAFKSDNLKPGKSFSFQFNKTGKFSYSCTYHPRMKGMITVTDPKPEKSVQAAS